MEMMKTKDFVVVGDLKELLQHVNLTQTLFGKKEDLKIFKLLRRVIPEIKQEIPGYDIMVIVSKEQK